MSDISKADVLAWLNERNKHIITTEQIDKAWELASLYFKEGFDQVCFDILRVFNIHRCEGCGGSGRIKNKTQPNGTFIIDAVCPDCAEWGSHGFVIGGE